jgi:hypothetical protein
MSAHTLGKECDLQIGTRDAIHVPIVIAKFYHHPYPGSADKNSEAWKNYVSTINLEPKPGDWVKFTDGKYDTITLCSKEEAHGMIDPFMDIIISSYDPVAVLLFPGTTSPVCHSFQINPEKRFTERNLLKEELEAQQAADPACAECWDVANGRVFRW